MKNPRLRNNDVHVLDSRTWWFGDKTFTISAWQYRYKIINRFTTYDVSIVTIDDVIDIFLNK